MDIQGVYKLISTLAVVDNLGRVVQRQVVLATGACHHEEYRHKVDEAIELLAKAGYIGQLKYCGDLQAVFTPRPESYYPNLPIV